MNNAQKITKLLEAGFMVLAEIEDECCIINCFNTEEKNQIRHSRWWKNINICKVDLGSDWSGIDNFEDCIITPIPHIYNEIKGRVDIINCPEIREMMRKGRWCDDAKDMIGQKGLKIREYYNNNGGQYYNIYTKDESDWYTFPAQFVIPSLEEVEEMTMEQVCKALGRNIKIKK